MVSPGILSIAKYIALLDSRLFEDKLMRGALAQSALTVRKGTVHHVLRSKGTYVCAEEFVA